MLLSLLMLRLLLLLLWLLLLLLLLGEAERRSARTEGAAALTDDRDGTPFPPDPPHWAPPLRDGPVGRCGRAVLQRCSAAANPRREASRASAHMAAQRADAPTLAMACSAQPPED